LIKNHQNSCDNIYQEAIENNFSHEYMTPLNPIMGFSALGKLRLINLYAEMLKIKDKPLNRKSSIERVNIRLLEEII